MDNLIFKNEDDSDVWLDDVYVFRTVEHEDYVPFYTGAFYLIFSGLLTLVFGYIEKKMNYYKG